MKASKLEKFSPLDCPIEGVNLIEASAGTGKTYGIAALFARLIILEDNYLVDNILVVTFTKAATAELKNRLRLRLTEILYILEHPQVEPDSNDQFLQDLLAKLAAENKPKDRTILRIQAALSNFDNAGIYTIHGFCRSIMQDEAFLCATPFKIELATNKDLLLEQAYHDFWRLKVAHNQVLSHLCFKKNLTAEKIYADIAKFTAKPYLQYTVPSADIDATQNELNQFWLTIRDDIPQLQDLFLEKVQPNLNGNKYRLKTFSQLFAQLINLSQQDFDYANINIKNLQKFDIASLNDAIKKGGNLDEKDINTLQVLTQLAEKVSALLAVQDQLLLKLRFDMLEFINHQLELAKSTSTERSFDDLLLDVYTGLNNKTTGPLLAQRLAQTWKVALIDEFQDTDPIQYQIFKSAFIEQKRPVFLVGDPKQAIYRFRGADIFAYLDALNDADHHYTLAQNFRSHQQLVAAFNALFNQKTERPFALEKIDYINIAAARKETTLALDSPALSVYKINELSKDEKSKSTKLPTVDELRQNAAEGCSNHIAQLLNQAQNITYDKRYLAAKDIAVLVRTHNEANLIAQELKNRGVQTVLVTRESVFASDEATAILAILQYILSPQKSSLLSFILTSCLYQKTAQEIKAILQDDQQVASWAERAYLAQLCWNKMGVYTALQQFTATSQLEELLIRRQQERSLTNLHQLQELLAEHEDQVFNQQALLDWFKLEIASAKNGNHTEENILRLESDESLIKIITIHTSKGLQYPIVYCPFLWRFSLQGKDDFIINCHLNERSILKGQSQITDTDKDSFQQELLSENLRLLYVALTRAKERMVLFVDNIDNKNIADNPLYYLFSETSAKLNTWQVWQDWYASLSNNDFVQLIEKLPEYTTYQQAQTENNHYQARQAVERTYRFERFASFSSLTRDAHSQIVDDELPVDEGESQIEKSVIISASDNIFTFPKGTQAGLCLHEILEYYPFELNSEEQSELIDSVLTKYGYPTEQWRTVIARMLEDTRLSQLNPQINLANIPPAQRLAEIHFLMAMSQFDLEQIKHWLLKQDISKDKAIELAIKQLDFAVLHGFINGFIDMTCMDNQHQLYVIDYKSNYLGDELADYQTAKLNVAIAEHHYYLQALIYALAIKRWAQLRGLTINTISIQYFFLRGLQQDSNQAIWRWDIAVENLAELDKKLNQT